jgi:membrane fusion protein (multidrug efflux system)
LLLTYQGMNRPAGLEDESQRPQGHPSGMRYLVVVAGVVVVIGGLAGVKAAQIGSLITFGKAAAAMGPPPEVVGTMAATAETWENRLFSVGTIAPVRGVTVSSEMAGEVVAIKFHSGQMVRQGQVLVELDRRVELADLAAAQARARLAEQTEQRTRALVNDQALPKAQLDNDESALQSATANVASVQAQIARKVVRAPFHGRLGIRQVNVGQYVTPGMPIVDLESTDASYVDFTLPQHQIERLRVGMRVRINENLPDRHGEAAITAIEPLVDAVARSGRVRALVHQADAPVSPGMFVNVAVILPEKREVTVLPATSLVHASFGDSVFVVERRAAEPRAPASATAGTTSQPGWFARQQFVKTGEARGDFVEILQGVSPGQQIVAQGAFKLRNGAPVAVNNGLGLAPELAPHPENR